MTLIDFKKTKQIRDKAREKAKELHRKMLDLAGNPQVLIDFIKEYKMDEALYKTKLETEMYLQNKKDKEDRDG